MTLFFAAALIAVVAWAIRRARQHAARAMALREALVSRRPYLQEEEVSEDWRELATAVNELITENQRLRQQGSDRIAQFEATLGSLREAVVIVDESNTIHFANQAVQEIFPRTRGLVSLRLELIARSPAFLDFVRDTHAGKSQPRTEFDLSSSTTPLCIEATGAPIPAPDGRGRWALFVIHDVTRQRQLERQRREFVANASHELRTPLTLIKGCVETLVDGHETMPTADRNRFLKTIERHGHRLEAIISDLLTLSRLESGADRLVQEHFSLQPFLRGVMDDAEQRAKATGHQLALDVPDDLPPIEADAGKLTQILTNLIDNALKYTPSGTAINLVARVVPENGEVELAVRDEGPGIPAEDLPNIFERFYRVEKGRSRETGGTGLGLSIVKHLAQLHSGRVWAESREGQGTAIIVRLPLRAAAA